MGEWIATHITDHSHVCENSQHADQIQTILNNNLDEEQVEVAAQSCVLCIKMSVYLKHLYCLALLCLPTLIILMQEEYYILYFKLQIQSTV